MMRICAMLAACFAASFANADIKPIVLNGIQFNPASVTITQAAQTQRYTQEQLEELGTYELETTTPWRDAPAVFSGVRLRDLLERNGLIDQEDLTVTAENGYKIVLERSVWVDYDPLLATRVDGNPHTRRDRGPIQLVFDMSSEPETGDVPFHKNWVWMLSGIDANAKP